LHSNQPLEQVKNKKRYSTGLGKIVEVAFIDVSEKHKAPIIYSKELIQ
jgi:hypothetical protein